jgi:23S rRNA (guanine745-N1)-methyltransferase
VDLGCGSGDALAHVAHAHAIAGIGIDLSTAAIERAARSNPEMTWVVANADRRLPLLDASVDRVLSLHARRNPAECARVMKRDGTLVVAVPAEDDLVELRALVQGAPLARDRTAALVDEHAPWFHLIDRAEARQSVTLDHDALRDLLRGTYRGERHSQSSALDGVHFLEVTLASRILRFAPLG